MADHAHHDHHQPPDGRALTRLAISATLHCLTGCAIGEVLGMVLATWWGWGDAASIALAVVLAFVFGYALTIGPVLRSGIAFKTAVRIALAADTISIFDDGDRRQRGPARGAGSDGGRSDQSGCSGAAWHSPSRWLSSSRCRSTGR